MKPFCYTHGEPAIYRDHLGYWFCFKCLNALFEWNQWIKDTLVLPEHKDVMMEMNKDIANKYKQNSREFYLRNPELADPRFLRKIQTSRRTE